MTEKVASARPAARLCIALHHHFLPELFAALSALGVESVLVESGRSVRERRTRRSFGLPGMLVRLDNNPLDLVWCTVAREDQERVLRLLAGKIRLDIPGRGSAVSQEVEDYSVRPLPALAFPAAAGEPRLFAELSMITIILSLPRSGKNISRIALELGAGVPMVSLGSGTGFRDRLGLLRITIPPEKELIRLVVPAADARGLVHQIIEEGKLDRPGRGFVYTTPVARGVLDTRLRIGPQQHPATMEQIISAIDQLTSGTGWRRRFDAPGAGMAGRSFQQELREISFLCPEGTVDIFLDHAMEAGAGGATTSRVQRLSLGSPEDGGTAWERCLITVPAGLTDAVIGALLQAEAGDAAAVIARLQVLDVPLAFSHGGRKQG